MRLNIEMKDLLNWRNILAIALVAIIIISRTIESVPNVSATAAVALFAGYLFGYRKGIMITLAGMLITDLFFKGFYDAGVMIAVYVGLSIPALLAQKSFNFTKAQKANQILNVASKSLIGSLAFFVISNLAVWLFSGMYVLDINGLANCFILAVPFFKLTWLGDLCFNALLFGSYFLVSQVSKKPSIA